MALEIVHLRSLILIICKTKKFKVIVNSTEWEMILELHEFDKPWMRYALGTDSHQANPIYVRGVPNFSAKSILKRLIT